MMKRFHSGFIKDVLCEVKCQLGIQFSGLGDSHSMMKGFLTQRFIIVEKLDHDENIQECLEKAKL